jgi:hypothetical protein
MTQYCPACADEVVPPSNNGNFLLIEEFPELCLPERAMSQWERKKDEWTPRKILQNELQKVGMTIHQFTIMSAFPHKVPDNGQPNEDCYNAGLEYALSCIPQYQGVVVMGTNLCRSFTGYELKQVLGLSDVVSQYIPDGDMPRVFLHNMKTIYATGAGEFHIGLERFASQLGA